MASPMTHLFKTELRAFLKMTAHQTQPDMNAYFRALSSHSSAMMVYLRKYLFTPLTHHFLTLLSHPRGRNLCREQ